MRGLRIKDSPYADCGLTAFGYPLGNDQATIIKVPFPEPVEGNRA